MYKGLWKGSIVAVKTIVLPANMSGQEKREKMAIMEAAISSALSHPNIMQTYTYDIKPIVDNSRADQNLLVLGDTAARSSGDTPSGGQLSSMSDSDPGVHSFEVRCDALVRLIYGACLQTVPLLSSNLLCACCFLHTR